MRAARSFELSCLFILLATLSGQYAHAQQAKSDQNKPQPSAFRWVNPLPRSAPEGLQHGQFFSEANQAQVGYCYLLPPGYASAENQQRRYPVIYWLHGGRPGSETKSMKMATFFQQAMDKGKIPPVIYVFPNGGRFSHYDHGEFKGEQAFLELIQHIDRNLRTIADRTGRAIEGFSQGGRGTGRDMFKHPELFCSAAPLGGGHQHEKRISENNGAESSSLVIDPPWNNTWDLAQRYAAKPNAPRLSIFIAVGTEDFNHQANREWSAHLTELGIDHQLVTVPGIPHSSQKLYEKIGEQIMNFHIDNFRRQGALKGADE